MGGVIYPKLEDISLDRAKIRKAIMKLKNGAVLGPDGIPVDILKFSVTSS